MFAEGFKCETQVIAFVLSADSENDPDVVGINACVLRADHFRTFRFWGRWARCEWAWSNGGFVVNPTYDRDARESLLNIMVVGTADGIVMIESGAKEVKEETVAGRDRIRAHRD
jgi:polyribonucleotide nucleotidyltransferase